jgi:hypothetical protein
MRAEIGNVPASQLFEELKSNRDKWRQSVGFSPDIDLAHEVLLYPKSSLAEKELALGLWLQRHQPCMFGRIAAKQGKMHYCILTGEHLSKSDDEIRGFISEENKLWKHRALLGGATTRHGFMLVILDEDIAFAEPNDALKRFSEKIRTLWVSESEPDSIGNYAACEDLYLRKPSDGRYYKFTFNIDFFASAGDKRWWLDHRIPGGIAFSANSLGHMLRHLEWYDDKSEKDSISWGVKEAMYTIASSVPHPKYGRSTELIDAVKGYALKGNACPFATDYKLPGPIQGKDWTTYKGTLHTDHSVRDEFFDMSDEPVRKARPYNMDFTYIYNIDDEDYVRFMGGQLISKNEIESLIGKPQDRRVFRARVKHRTAAQIESINQALNKMQHWEISEAELTDSLP